MRERKRGEGGGGRKEGGGEGRREMREKGNAVNNNYWLEA